MLPSAAVGSAPLPLVLPSAAVGSAPLLSVDSGNSLITPLITIELLSGDSGNSMPLSLGGGRAARRLPTLDSIEGNCSLDVCRLPIMESGPSAAAGQKG